MFLDQLGLGLNVGADFARVRPSIAPLEAVNGGGSYSFPLGDLAAGDTSGATRRLRAAAIRLLEVGEEELATEMERQAAELEQRGQADPQRSKGLRYETRKLTR